MSPMATYKQRLKQLIILTLILLLAFGYLHVQTAHAAQTFVVTTTADNGDNLNPTPGSLRAAIISANTTPGADVITFQIGTGLQTIKPPVQLPFIKDPVTIDGTTQPGFAGAPVIELDGSASTNSYGLGVQTTDSTIRGLIINRFSYSAIWLDGENNRVAGNYLGTDATGKSAFSGNNNSVGVIITASNNIVGGTAPADRNIISGNHNSNGGGTGISVSRFSEPPILNNKIIGNYIGTDATGNSAMNPSTSRGVAIDQYAVGTIIGGAQPGEGNVISGNITGLDIQGKNTVVQGNYIGLRADGNGLGGGFHGIAIETGATGNLIGGTNPGEGNVIAFNSSRGVLVLGDTTSNNAILGNSIYSNSGLGIDHKFDGVTPNDNMDADKGPNALQNYPVLTSVVSDPSNTTINGTLNSEAGKPYRIELFANSSCHSSGYGEGRFFVTATAVTTDANGNASFSFTVPSANWKGATFVATATDSLTNNTSEFSQCQAAAVVSPGKFQFGTDSISVLEGVGTVKATVTRTGGSSGAVSVNFATSDGNGIAGQDYMATSGVLNFADGEISKQISVEILNDKVAEPSKYFQIALSNPTGGATLGSQKSMSVIIVDDDTPQFSINDVQVKEGDSGTTNATFTVSLSNAYYQQVSVDFATLDTGTATSGADYQPTSGTVTFNIGETSKPVTVLVNGDKSEEPDETFVVKLSNNTKVPMGDSTGTGTIIDDDGPQNAFQLSSTDYSVNENDASGVATITVNRVGDTSSAGSVDYYTSDASGLIPCQANGSGIASERCDYATAAGTLRFAAGETQKTIQIPIINDAYIEPVETFSVTLRNPKGSTLGATSTATVSIQNDDLQTAAQSPIDDQAFFIRQQYIDFLGRVAEPAGFDFWMNRMNNCPAGQTCDRIDTSLRFFQSDEFQQRGFYVYRLYDAVIGRLPKYAEFVSDVARLNGFQTPKEQRQSKDAYLADLLNKAEFKTLYGQYLSPDMQTATNAQGFVDALCARAGVTPALRDGLINDLQSNARTPAQILEDFILQPEMSAVGTKFYDRGFITMQYFGYLRRDPDAAGLQFWQNQLMGDSAPHKQDYRFMVGGFIGSDEYRFRLALISAP